MIYLIGCNGFVKIGVSARPWARLAEFQTANPHPLEMLAVGPGDFGFEAELHKLFGEHRGVGEWFKDSERIRSVASFLRQTFPELQTCRHDAPEEEAATIRTDTTTENDGDTEWRVEKRTYTKKDGSVSVYQNYRRRKVDHDPETGRQRIEYRRIEAIP